MFTITVIGTGASMAQAIEDFTRQVKSLVVEASEKAAPPTPDTPDTPDVPPPAAPKRKRKAKADPVVGKIKPTTDPEPVAEGNVPENNSDDDSENSGVDSVLTEEHVRAAATSFASTYGTGALQALLSGYEVRRVREIPENQWPRFLTDLHEAAKARETTP